MDEEMTGVPHVEDAEPFPGWTVDDQATAIGYGWKLARSTDDALEAVPDGSEIRTYDDADGPRRILERIEEGVKAPWHMRHREIELCRRAWKAIRDAALLHD